MTLGRPPTFTAVEDIPVPSAVDLAQFSPAGDSLDSDPLICNFFVQNSRAARMLGKILHRVYHPSLSTVSKASARSTQLPAAADALSAILGLHSELNDLASSSLSALELCVDQGSRANMVVERQRNVLNSRLAQSDDTWGALQTDRSSQIPPHEGFVTPPMLYQLLLPRPIGRSSDINGRR